MRRARLACRTADAGLLWLSLVLLSAGSACEDTPTWEVHPWRIPNAGGRWLPDGGDLDAARPFPDYENPRSEFDPEQVYLLGARDTSTCGPDAIVSVLKPDEVTVGLACNFVSRSAQIGPLDGRLRYVVQGALYEFNADVNDMEATDTPIPTEACSREGKQLQDFKVSATGKLYYRCAGDWYDEGHRFVASFWDTMLQIGVDGTALTETGVHTFASIPAVEPDGGPADGGVDGGLVLDAGVDGGLVLDADVDGGLALDAALEAGTPADAGADDAGKTPAPVRDPLRPFVGLPRSFTVLATRVRLDGYWLALTVAALSEQLWHVDFEGHGTLVGVYPSEPRAQSPSAHGARLDAQGRLYQIVFESSGSSREIVVRRSLTRENITVWTDLATPHVEIASEYLVTGP